MSTLVFELMTKRPSCEELSPEASRALTDWIESGLYPESEKQRLYSGVLRRMEYQPLFLSITGAGLWDPLRKCGVLYQVGETAASVSVSPYLVVKTRSEADLVRELWAGMCAYDTLITFDGRRRALPILRQRSRVYGIPPTVAWPSGRQPGLLSPVRHIDLYDEGNSYGINRHPAALAVWVEAFQLPVAVLPAGLPEAFASIYERTAAIQQLYERFYPPVLGQV